MRCTQFFGLHNTANKFLEDNGKIVVTSECPNCHHPLTHGLESTIYKDASYVGMFDDGPQLKEYQLKDGRQAYEVVQDAPWSSGPCIFLCLEVDGKRIGEWPQEEIDRA